MKLKIQNVTFHHGSDSFFYEAEISDQITGIFGDSGSGKTTLLNLLCGIDIPETGFIKFNGRYLFHADRGIHIPAYKRKMGVVFQGNTLFPHLNVKRNLLYSNAYKSGPQHGIQYQDVVDLLNIRNLLDKKPCHLSGGECQRVAIGRGLLSQPEMLLMDEPFSNLDRGRRMEIITYLEKITDAFNIPLLIVSHDLDDLLRLSPNLLLISDGHIQAAGNYFDILRKGSPEKDHIPLRHIQPFQSGNFRCG